MNADRSPLTEAQRKYDDYMTTFDARRKQNPSWREGQTHFNVLYWDGFDPEFANEIRESDLDPFHVDDRLPAYFDALRGRWGV